MATTAERVIAACGVYNIKEERAGHYIMNSPFRAGSDSMSFKLEITDGEHGMFFDHKGDFGGSLYDLAKQLGIETPRREIQSSKRPYTSLKDYAELKGVPVEAFAAAGWKDTTYQNRPAIEFPTRNGKRWRFLDGKEPRFKSVYGYTACWYGLDRAVQMAQQAGKPLIICNGEPSTIVAQHFGLPAVALTNGEGKDIHPALIDQLKDKWHGEIVVALDCDDTGHNGARKYLNAVTERSIRAIDLGLDEHGDLADACKLYGKDVADYVYKQCANLFAGESAKVQEVAAAPFITDQQALDQYIGEITGEIAIGAQPIENPFAFMHKYGGFAKNMVPGKIGFLVSISGGTKTTGMETGITLLQQAGVHSIFYTPEWVDETGGAEVAARSVQRAGGMSHMARTEHLMALQNPEAGRLLPAETVAGSVSRAQYLKNVPGRVYYITKPNLSVEELSDVIEATIYLGDKNGQRPRVLWIDYAQLLWLQKDGRQRNWMEEAIAQVKACCRKHNLVGFISSQVRKDDAELAKGETALDASMMQWLSDQQANLVFAFAPKYEDGQQVYVPHSRDKNIKLGVMRGRILKNSMANTDRSEFTFFANFDRLMWEWEAA